MVKWAFCVVMTVAFLFVGSETLMAQELTIQIANCPTRVKAGQKLDSSFKVVVANNGDIELKDIALEFVLKKNPNCKTPTRHASYSSDYFDGVLLQGGRESVSLTPKQKVTLSPHGANTIPVNTPVGRTYSLCAVIIAGDKVKEIGEENNCACCQIRVVGVQERSVITGYGETCISRRGTATILGRNFGSADGKSVFLTGAGASINLPVISWSDYAINVRIPDDANIQVDQRYFAGIRKVGSAELLSNTGVSVSVCPEQKTMPNSAPIVLPVQPYIFP